MSLSNVLEEEQVCCSSLILNKIIVNIVQTNIKKEFFSRTLWYNYQYSKSDSYDNYFINDDFKNVNNVRMENGHKNMLPLKFLERFKYITKSMYVLIST